MVWPTPLSKHLLWIWIKLSFLGSEPNRYTAPFTSARANTILSTTQDQIGTPLFLRVQEQTQSFPSSESNRYTALFTNLRANSILSKAQDQTSRIVWNFIETHHTPQLFKVVDLHFSHYTRHLSRNKINKK